MNGTVGKLLGGLFAVAMIVTVASDERWSSPTRTTDAQATSGSLVIVDSPQPQPFSAVRIREGHDHTTENPQAILTARFHDAVSPAVLDVSSAEMNIEPMTPRSDRERHWKHRITPLPPARTTETEDVALLTKLFEHYRQAPQSLDNIPVYAVPCTNECELIPNHWRNMAGGLGHFIVIVNRPAPEHVRLFRALELRFPNRFTLLHYPNGGGNAESMNSGLRLGFAIRPMPAFVQVANGDLWVNREYSNAYSRFNHLRADTVGVTQVRGFSHFSVTRLGWDRIGVFDEAAYPAEFDDTEFILRMHLLGVPYCDYPAGGVQGLGFNNDKLQDEVFTHMQGGSFAGRETRFQTEVVRWARIEYISRKFGNGAFRSPFNVTGLPWRHSTFFDPQHRHCIETGSGPHYITKGNRTWCHAELCAGCYWNATNAFAPHKLPPGTEIPAMVTSEERQVYP